ncbi:hypothetical protein OJ997_16800 [Solirubrobacter phytolaccae]|uniref:Uncharacterized protein n=1 Tax=Solirubrobacter phytolaccae TaxID=1404360 RepID=A0A9X3NBP9_9ACTN|nr:hypothetical protein [Solirubrobacter phytolaccae]MDA0181965.1 hypothetical protein [Solirubrobacter phytolaccae]
MAGTAMWTVWAHRTSAGWAMVRPTGGNRIPSCRGDDGLLDTVPEPVVVELRGSCVNPGSDRGFEPRDVYSLRIYRNRLHRYDDDGPEVSLQSMNTARSFTLSHYDRKAPRLKALREGLGTPRRAGCEARWPRLGLTARACGGRVTRLTLTGARWRLEGDAEADAFVTGQEVLIGDSVPLARYLDARLAKLPTHGRLRLPPMRIGRVRVAVSVVTRADHIVAIDFAIR